MKDFTITYQDEPDGIRNAVTPALADNAAFADLQDMLVDGNMPPRVSTFEDGYWRLGTEFKFFPDNPDDYTWGAFSTRQCDVYGAFDPPLTLQLPFTGLYSSVGLTIGFDPYGPTYCTDMTITWYRAGVVIHSQDFQPDQWQYTAIAQVANFDEIRIQFKRMSAGYRYLKIAQLMFGIMRTFDSSECYSVNLFQDTDLLSDEVSINTMDFELRNKSDIGFLFQRKQVLRAKFGDELLGKYYISKSEKIGRNRYDVHSVDQLGLLDMGADHWGGMYNGTYAEDIAREIVGDGIPLVMSEELRQVPIYGYLPKATKRDNLRQLAFALSAMVCTGHRECIEIKRASTAQLEGHFDNDTNAAYENGSISSDNLVTAVHVTAHSYLQDGEAVTLYEGTVMSSAGDVSVSFSEPAYGVTISGGTLVNWDCNHAVIRGTGSKVTVTGYKYNHVTRVYTKRNPLRNANDEENEISYDDMTLVSEYNVTDVLSACYARNLRLNTIKGKVITEHERVGDYVSILTDDDGIKTGHLLSMDYVASTKLAADVTILADYEGDDAG